MADQPGPDANPSATPLVGRERELARLGDVLTAALAGHGALVLIGGEAGIGKTALAERLCAEAAARQGVLVLVGHCYDLAETSPYGPWAEAFSRVPRDRDLATLPAALGGIGPDDGTESQAALFRQTRDFLHALAANTPVVLALEDLHWADQPSLDLLRTLGRDLGGVPLLLLATYRAEEVARRHPLYGLLPTLVRETRATRLDLHPLDAGDLRALVRQAHPLLPSDEDRLVAHLAARTEGNPLYAGELLRSLTEAGVLRPVGSPGKRASGTNVAWMLGDLTRVDLPPLLRQVIDARIDRLGEEVRTSLAVAAVIGQEVPIGLWAAVTGADEATLAVAAEAATGARLLVEVGDSIRFAHALFREALYAGLPALRRRALHRRVAEALLAAPGGGTSDPDTVAFHLGRAGDPRELAWLIRAGERALASHAPQAAVERLTRALELAERQGVVPSLTLRHTRGLARETLGDHAGALADLEATSAAARAAGDVRAEWHAQLDLGQLWAARDYARAGTHLEQALALARALADPAALAGSLNRLGNWLVNTGKPVEGVGHHREAFAHLEGLDDRLGMAETLDLLGMAQWVGLGAMAAAVRDFGRAIDILRALDLPRHLSNCLVSRAVAASPEVIEPVGSALWTPEACLRDMAEGRQLAEATDWPAGQAYADFQAGLALGSFGLFGDSLEYLGRALDLATAIDHRQWIAAARYSLGHVYVLCLMPETAREHLQIGLTMANDVGSSWWAASITTYLALAHLQEHDTGAAETVLAALLSPEQALSLAPGILQERRIAWAWSEVRLAQGRPAAALELADALLRTAPGSGPIPALLTVRGEALLALGRPDEAVAALDDAVRGASARHERPRLWRAQFALRAAHRALGQADLAARAFDLARATIEELAATLPEGTLRAGFLRAAGAHPPESARMPLTPAPARLPFGLTAREVEVLRLVAEGLPNTQIAERLFVSPHTVNGHLKVIFGKLGVNTRAAAVRLALERGLT